MVGDVAEMLRRLIGEDIDFVTALGDDLGRVKADPGQIAQVVMNLGVNARDAMPGGGKLTLETANVQLHEGLAANHAVAGPGRYVMLAITDTGCGMDDETKSRLFEPFFTTKQEGKGTGLGLSTVYGIVRQSGGSISVHTTPGRGTTFKIYLPRTEEEAPSEAERTVITGKAKEGRRGNGEQLLVVEDEPALRDVFRRMLERLGYRVTVAANGKQALLHIEESGLKPDLVVTDLVMPGMDGVALIERLRRTRPNLRVLCMSGYADNAEALDGGLASGTSFIRKPFGAADLATKIARLLRERPAPARKRILMVDDDADVRALVARVCAQRGHEFVGAGTSAAALEALTGRAFGVLLVDLDIPGTSATSLLQQIRAAGHSTPAIVFSGEVGAADMQVLRPLGVVEAVDKSRGLQALMHAVESLV